MKNKVDGHPHLFKDKESGVIINRETTDRSRYRMAKQQAQMNIDSQSELSSLRSEMDEIKSLLHELLKKQVQ
tara:strand:+ start:8488 stop:8703 length:216 start_codon:yes stop_codon:yes gene_type:complete